MREQYTKKFVPRARELRLGQTPAERKLWFEFLKHHPVKFRRQVPLQWYVLDFYAPAIKLCIELDGQTHDTPDAQEYDQERTHQLSATGIEIIRFQNREVLNTFDGVCALIDATCARKTPQ